ncbi:MAG: hypothetical protein DCC58_04575 [Chloroflexi bacterium]|nr:MAG: hypothetical protein DCC58_04575 [Chloroflexota bacterium]
MYRHDLQRSFPGFSILGVSLRVNWLWLVVTIVIAGITIESLAPNRPIAELYGWIASAALIATGLLLSLLVHDAAHILAGRSTGSKVRAIEPALLGNLSDAAFPPTTPGTEAIVALSGPAASALTGGLLLATSLLAPTSSQSVASSLLVLGFFNLGLCSLSMLPGYPYDGGRALRAFIWYISDDLTTGTRLAAAYGQFLAAFGFVAGLTALAAGEPYAVWGAWGLLFLWSMNRASHEGVERTVWQEMARTTTVGEIVMGAATRIPADATIDEAIDRVLDAIHHGPILVTHNGQITGAFSLSRVRRIPRALWPERHVGEVAASIDALHRVNEDDSALLLLDIFSNPEVDLVLVEARDGDRLLGALDREIAEQRLRDRISSERRRRRGG